MNTSKTKVSVPKNVMDKKLYARVRNSVKKKVKVWPSAYASGQVVQEYKRRGGRYSKSTKGTKGTKGTKSTKSTKGTRSTRSTRFNHFGNDYYIPGSENSNFYTPYVRSCLQQFYEKPVMRFGNVNRWYKNLN